MGDQGHDDRDRTNGFSRRDLLRGGAAGAVVSGVLPRALRGEAEAADTVSGTELVGPGPVPMTFTVNGRRLDAKLEPRVTLLDALRERLGLAGTKKGCDQGQCGACTVHVDGERVLACLTLAVQVEGRTVTTIEGLSPKGGALHPVQAAFLEHDAFQCGYCTPGQIMSAVACIREGHAGSDDEVREYMSGNLCRCGAYPHIVAAVREAAEA
jgi:xanthine dehydrogenase YagT iron-sulfur-binding subunit